MVCSRSLVGTSEGLVSGRGILARHLVVISSCLVITSNLVSNRGNLVSSGGKLIPSFSQ